VARPERTCSGLCYDRCRPRLCGRSLKMPNIKQQKKRVRTAAQERLENLRFRSTAKTLVRRLQAAVTEGDEARVTEEHKQLVSWLDRAAARGAIHKNTAARRKSQADRLASGPRA
jgi:small subunit ribosomal protein S20